MTCHNSQCSPNLGVICSQEGAELAAIIKATETGQLSGAIKIVIADRDSAALALARHCGLYGVFLPRAIFHDNRDGFERRLVEILTQAEVDTVILAGFNRELGQILTGAFPGRIYGQGLGTNELISELEKI